MSAKAMPDPRPPMQQLNEVREKLIGLYAEMIRLLEDECHPDRLEREMAFERHLQSRYTDCWMRKKKEEGRNALA